MQLSQVNGPDGLIKMIVLKEVQRILRELELLTGHPTPHRVSINWMISMYLLVIIVSISIAMIDKIDDINFVVDSLYRSIGFIMALGAYWLLYCENPSLQILLNRLELLVNRREFRNRH